MYGSSREAPRRARRLSTFRSCADLGGGVGTWITGAFTAVGTNSVGLNSAAAVRFENGLSLEGWKGNELWLRVGLLCDWVEGVKENS